MRTWRRVVVVLVVLGTAFLFYRWWQGAAERVRAHGASAGEQGDEEPAREQADAGGD
ncbi:MAG: hypothetical protein ACRELB_13130 [Polyangiaceae bacterium]